MTPPLCEEDRSRRSKSSRRPLGFACSSIADSSATFLAVAMRRVSNKCAAVRPSDAA